ncbi:coiled-coil domain-containing 24-like [Brachionus plicatilis]|uniref:Coiled-coil domain-containing 24-like n=1 Tax=Brachionus plicatilis TaxID=10195 RepID=A0A3M7RXC1_BRAPC|nr:coiled-coil domain-containing 24-like [Brachionus plicatilis]
MNDSPNMMDAVDLLAYDPPPSLWQYVQSLANRAELDAIRQKIGHDLVEESLELHAEIDNLLEIWRDYRHETEQSLHNIRSNAHKKLLEPANVVAEKIGVMFQTEIAQLKKDIDFLMDCLDREKEYRTVCSQVIREPTIYELKDERNKLESDLLSCKNLVKISKLPSSVSATRSNRSINSPVMNSRASPPSSAGSARSVTSVASVRSESKHRSAVLKPSIVNTAQSVSKLKLDLIKSNSSSVDLNSSSSSSINTANKTSSVQKFRQMNF